MVKEEQEINNLKIHAECSLLCHQAWNQDFALCCIFQVRPFQLRILTNTHFVFEIDVRKTELKMP